MLVQVYNNDLEIFTSVLLTKQKILKKKNIY